MKIGIITLSDKGYIGKREDISGKLLKNILKSKFKSAEFFYSILPDEEKLISKKLKELSDKLKCDLIVTTGGTGISIRDVTPEATSKVIHKLIPGISEAIRIFSFKNTKMSIISRGIAGIRNKTLIINLPGSPNAIKQSLKIILPAIEHSLEILEKGNIEHK